MIIENSSVKVKVPNFIRVYVLIILTFPPRHDMLKNCVEPPRSANIDLKWKDNFYLLTIQQFLQKHETNSEECKIKNTNSYGAFLK